MKKPEERKEIDGYDCGYNDGLNAREKWLKEFMPSEDEIISLINAHFAICQVVTKEIAQIVSKRLRGEK